MRMLSRVLLGEFLLIACGSAATYYVAPAGGDASPGTLMQPFRTIAKAVAAAAAGDTIILRDGTYGKEGAGRDTSGDTISAPVVINKAGTPSAWITLKAEHKWGAILDCEDTPASAGCDAYIRLGGAAAYWKIEDIVLTRCYWTGIHSNAGASYITIEGCLFEALGRHPSTSVYGETGTGANEVSHDLIFDRNVFHEIGRTAGNYLSNDHALYLRSTNTTIINNIFYRPISGWPIQTARGFSGLIANNTFAFAHPSSNGAIVLWGENGDVTIRNNIFYLPKGSAITVTGWSLFDGSACTIDHNLIYGVSDVLDADAPCSVSANRVADPMLANTTRPPFDFHLLPGSPAIASGVDVPGVTTDIEGNARPAGANDIGAYQVPNAPPRRIWITDPITVPGEGSERSKSRKTNK